MMLDNFRLLHLPLELDGRVNRWVCLWDLLRIYKKGRTVLPKTFDMVLYQRFVERPVLGGQLRMHRWGEDCQIGALPAPHESMITCESS
jgi:hypothetical protein